MPEPETDGRPTILTDRLVLRPFRETDAAAVARLCGDREIASTTLLIPHPYALGDAEGWIATHAASFGAGRGVDFAVSLRTTGELVGAVGLRIEPEHGRAEIGYWIGRAHWGLGYASEAGKGALRYAFELRGLNRVYAYHFARNPASGRVMEKMGMRREGIMRRHVLKWGEYEDCVLYGILREDWAALPAAGRGRP